MTPEKFVRKGARPGSCDPINFRALNANSSKTDKNTKFTFGKHAHRECPDMTPEKNFQKGIVARVTCPHKFCALNTNSSKMAKGVNLNLASMLPRKVST